MVFERFCSISHISLCLQLEKVVEAKRQITLHRWASLFGNSTLLCVHAITLHCRTQGHCPIQVVLNPVGCLQHNQIRNF